VTRYYIRCETTRDNFGWCVRVVESEGFSLTAGDKLSAQEHGLFESVDPGEEVFFAFSNRAKARAALRSYKKRIPYIKVIGGLH
jgi:hypothetical protein